MLFYSIGEFAKLIGVSTHTLRNWDNNGRLKSHHKTKGGQRIYTDEQVRQYLNDEPSEDGVVRILGDKLQKDGIDSLSESELSKLEKAVSNQKIKLRGSEERKEL